MTKEIGKIAKIRFGKGGYQDAMLGVSVWLSGVGWGVNDFWGTWAMERSEHAKWTEEDRIKIWGEMVSRLNNLMSEAHAESVTDLVNTPIEATFDGQRLVSWRILTEVL